MAAGLPPDPPLDTDLVGDLTHLTDHSVIHGTLAMLREAAGMTVAEIGTDLAAAGAVADALALKADSADLGTAAAMTPTEVVEDAGAQASLSGAFVAVLGDSTGVDDTSLIQAALTANAGQVVRGKPGETYLISEPLVISSGTTLDMTGCTVQLIEGSDSKMLYNTGQTAQRSVSDAAITSGSKTLTSATAAFTAGDVGRSVTIAGALAATAPLTATITAYTNSTTVTLAQAAAATVSGAAASIFTRDTNISVIGGTWDRQANHTAAPTVLDLHSISLVHVDGVTVRDVRYQSTNGKYGVYLADVTDFLVDGCRFDADSDGVHISGPASRGVIANTFGTTGDDTVALTANNYANYNETAGDITDVEIRSVNAASGSNVVRVIGGVGTTVDRIFVDGVHGTAAANAVGCGNDTASTNTTGGTYKTLIFKGVTALPTTGATDQFGFPLPNCANLTVRDSKWDNAYGNNGISLVGSASLDRVTIENYVVVGGGSNKVAIYQNQAVNRMDVRGCTMLGSPSGISHLVSMAGATNITELFVDGCACQWSGTSGALVFSNGAGRPVNLRVTNCHTYAGLGAYGSSTNSGAMRVVIATSHFQNAVNLIKNQSSALITCTLQGVYADTLSGAAFALTNSASIAVLGGGLMTNGTFNLLSRSAAQSMRVDGPTLPCDVSTLTPTDGDLAYNTNGALGCGTGPAVYQTTAAKWKGLYSGATN